MNGFTGNIEELTLANTNFRKVLYTGSHQQLVLMTLSPGEEIGQEVHKNTDQFFRFESGSGKVIIDGKEYPVRDGSAVIVPAGASHNVINTSDNMPLMLYTIYSPPHHKDGVVHKTRKDALADTEDHL